MLMYSTHLKRKYIEDEVVEFEEPPIEFEIIEFDLEDIAPEIVVEIPVQDEIEEEIVDEKLKRMSRSFG